jgi:cytochrome c-type biogenesis protein CcmH/NrfG
MQWRAAPGGTDAAKAGTTSVADQYSRSAGTKPLYDKAQEAIKKDDNDQAISLLRQVVSADPKDFEAWTELGTAYFKKKKLDDAEKAYRSALEQRPAYIVALLNLGKLRISQKKYDGAIEALSQAVAAQPQSAEINYWLGEAYLQVKKGSKAVGYLNEAIRLDPAGMAEVHLRLATLYNAAGLKDRAAAEYEQFLAKKPDYPDKKKLEQYIQENKK